MAAERLQRRLAAILAADVVGYSRMVQADEAGTVARLKSLQSELIMPMIARDGGRVVKLMGDGVLVEFASAVDAVRNAIGIQAEMAKRNADQAEDHRIAFRIGVNVGDVIIDGEDIHGDGVNVAARLEGLCEPGGVYVSGTVHDYVEGKLEAAFDDLGEQAVKNITRPVRVYRVRMDENGSSRPSPRTVSPPPPDKPSIAVLAFNNMSGDAEQEYFSDGISEDVITDLSKLANVHVIARNSSFVYKNAAVSVPEVARELGVRYILEGSVRKAGNRVRVTAQLIDSTTGGHVWADRFDRDLTDIFAVQDELTHEIVSALKLTLSPDEADRLAHKGTADVEAYNLFLRGRDQVWLHTKTGNIGARDLIRARHRDRSGLRGRSRPCGLHPHKRFRQRMDRGPGPVPGNRIANRAASGEHRCSGTPCPFRAFFRLQMERRNRCGVGRGPTVSRARAQFGRRTHWDRPYRDLRRRCGSGDRVARCLYAARSALPGYRIAILGRSAHLAGPIRRRCPGAEKTAGAQSRLRDRLCLACIVLRPPRAGCGRPKSLG